MPVSPHKTKEGSKVRSKWNYLFRAIGRDGRTLDFYLSNAGNAHAAKRFPAKALKRSGHDQPLKINTDKNPAYGEAIRELKREGQLPADCQPGQAKYLNTVIEADHGKLKRLIKPTLGF